MCVNKKEKENTGGGMYARGMSSSAGGSGDRFRDRLRRGGQWSVKLIHSETKLSKLLLLGKSAPFRIHFGICVVEDARVTLSIHQRSRHQTSPEIHTTAVESQNLSAVRLKGVKGDSTSA